MDNAFRFALWVVLLGCASTTITTSPIKGDFQHCKNTVKHWASSSLHSDVRKDKHKLRDFLFFLHVPRTGGRTYFHCFLKKLYSSSLECPRSYDRLRFDPSKPNCSLMVTHDDYSMMSKLPKGRASVVTIQRRPVDRVFSTYEFSIEVAARFLIHPNLSSARNMEVRLREETKGASTLDIWPWKYLVPWMREDLFARRDGRKHWGQISIKSNDTYNVEDIVMPLHEYINHPIARDIIHNGATFQVAGLTNNSYIGESHKVRHCVLTYQTLGKYVLEVAKKRLDDMLYVGLTENHKESATMFANVVGTQVISKLMAFNSTGADNKSEQSSPFADSKTDTYHQNSTKDQKARKHLSAENIQSMNGSMTLEKVMKTYASCISGLRISQSHRRVTSFKLIPPANFTNEARLHVPEGVLEEIMSLNSLDMELYEYAQAIFAKQRTQMHQKSVSPEKLESIFYGSFAVPLWEVMSLSILLLFLFILLFVNARRRAFKLKI
ncbi:hypothetical protein LguiA_012259 [Lonicera macranthoides]